jgi:hypothetical protein
MGNFGFRARRKCLNLTISCIFIIVRIVMLVFFCYYIIPKVSWLLINTYNFKSPFSTIFSSDSALNSIFGFVFWLFFIIIDYLWKILSLIFVVSFFLWIFYVFAFTDCSEIREGISYVYWILFFALSFVVYLTVFYISGKSIGELLKDPLGFDRPRDGYDYDYENE